MSAAFAASAASAAFAASIACVVSTVACLLLLLPLCCRVGGWGKERYTPGCVCNVGSTETGSLSLERKFVVMSQVTVFSRNGEAESWDIMSRRSIGSPRSLTSVRFGDVHEASFLSESCLSSTRLSKSRPQLMSRQKLDYAENNHPFCVCIRGTTRSLNYTSSILVQFGKQRPCGEAD